MLIMTSLSWQQVAFLDAIFLQVKSSIIKQLSAVQVESVERIQQTSNVIAEAVSIVNEVTVEAQVYVAHWIFVNKHLQL